MEVYKKYDYYNQSKRLTFGTMYRRKEKRKRKGRVECENK